METKKSKKADLEWKKPVFFQLGVFMALALVLVMFELVGAREKDVQQIDWGEPNIDNDIVIPTKVDPVIPKPKVVPLSNTILKIIKDIDNSADVVTIDAGIDQSTKVDEIAYVEPIPEPDADRGEIFKVVEIDPRFPGEKGAFQQYLKENIVYPRAAREADIEGTVYVEFVVEKDGSLTDVKIARSRSPLLDQEALRVIKAMPKWIPGVQRNKTVRVRLSIPIKFELL